MTNRFAGLPDALAIEMRDDICVVTLNRPEQANAVNAELHTALSQVWSLISSNIDIRAVVLTGGGKAFCGGGDLGWFAEIARNSALRATVFAEARQMIHGMIELGVPVVAAVNGPAVGLGCSLVLLTDFVVMADDAFLADPHVAVGLVAGDGGVVSWPLMTSLLRAKEFILLGDRIPASEAERFGLANRVVASEDLMSEAMRFAVRFAALPSTAVRDTKRALNMHLADSVLRVLDYALAAESESFLSEEHAQAMRDLQGRQ